MDWIHQIEEAYEVYGHVSTCPFIFTCEHASNRIPPPLTSTKSDEPYLQTHWAWDIGTKALCKELVRRTNSVAVMARFSRLVCDANRHRDRPDVILPVIENYELSFNKYIDEAEVVRRIELSHETFHRGLHQLVLERSQNNQPVLLISMHSFTPIWDMKIRTMDVGILFDHLTPIAAQMQKLFMEEDVFVAMNEPYSGQFGLMYSAERHGRHHDIRHIELEFNQSQLCTEAHVQKMADKMERVLGKLDILSSPLPSEYRDQLLHYV